MEAYEKNITYKQTAEAYGILGWGGTIMAPYREILNPITERSVMAPLNANFHIATTDKAPLSTCDRDNARHKQRCHGSCLPSFLSYTI